MDGKPLTVAVGGEVDGRSQTAAQDRLSSLSRWAVKDVKNAAVNACKTGFPADGFVTFVYTAYCSRAITALRAFSIPPKGLPFHGV